MSETRAWGQRSAEPVDGKRFQVRGAAITKLFRALSILTWNHSKCMCTFSDEPNFSAGDSFCNSTVFAPETSAESFDTEDEPNKGSGLILEIFAGSCRFSKACKTLASEC